jgi:Superinfection immunity protein
MIQILARTGIELAYVDHVPFSERMYALGVVGILAIIYMIPTGIAVFGKHPAAVGIAALNITLGWTGIVWIVVFIWACIKPRKSIEVIPQYLPAAPPPIPTRPRLETSLEELHKLKEKSLITEEEFQERRKQLLARF